MSSKQSQPQFDEGGKRLLELGLSFTPPRLYTGFIQLRCFRDPVTISLEAGPADVPKSQVEAVERLFAEQSRKVERVALRVVYDALKAWYQRQTGNSRHPTLRWVQDNVQIGEIYFPPPTKKNLRPLFGLFAYRGKDDEHPANVVFAWTGTGWEVVSGINE